MRPTTHTLLDPSSPSQRARGLCALAVMTKAPRAEDDPLARLRQLFGGGDERARGKRRAVGVDEAERVVAGGEEIGGGVGESRAEVVAALREEREVVRQ